MTRLLRLGAALLLCLGAIAFPFSALARQRVNDITTSKRYISDAQLNFSNCTGTGFLVTSATDGLGGSCFDLASLGADTQDLLDVSIADEFNDDVAFEIDFDNSTGNTGNIFAFVTGCDSLSEVAIPEGTTRIWIYVGVDMPLYAECGNSGIKGTVNFSIYNIIEDEA